MCRKISKIQFEEQFVQKYEKEERIMREKATVDKVLNGGLELYKSGNSLFTMDELAASLKMSKKTIYKFFPDKETLYIKICERFFDGVREVKNEVVRQKDLPVTTRLRKMLGLMPENYKGIEFRQLYILKDKHPRVYEYIEQRLESDWQSTIDLLNEGMANGELRQFSIPVFKTMMETSLERFFERDVLVKNNITYEDALSEVVTILVDGITAKK